MSRPYVHLHVHSHYSLLCGAIRLKKLFPRLKELGMDCVAMTDRSQMFGAIDFQLQCKKAGVKPIFGTELLYLPSLDSSESSSHLVCLAMNEAGYKSLRHLSSRSYLDGQNHHGPHMDWTMLQQNHEGLIVLSGGVLGVVERCLIEQGEDEAEKVALRFDQLLGRGQFFLEVQALKTNRQERINQFFQKLNQKHGIPLVATNEAYYMYQEDARNYKVLSCISSGQNLREYEDEYTLSDQHWLKDGDTIASQLGPAFDEAINNTLKIAQRCDFKIPLGDVFLPDFKVPKEHNIQSFLRHCSHEGLRERFAEFDKADKAYDLAEYEDRLNIELDIIINMDFPGYFLIVQDFINWAKDQGIPVGPGRGSGAGSLVAYALRITDIDPLPYGLLFERFLNPERVSMPDFDIDFCMNRRGEVIEYVTHKYGKMNVGQIATYGALKAKGVIKDVGRVLGFHYNDTDRLSKLIPDQLGITLEQSLVEEPRLAKMYEDDRQIRDLIDIAKSLEGLHRNVGMHAAGIVIGDEPLWHYCPVFRGANQELITQFAKEEVELAGLVKFDFLGLKTLTVIQDAVDLVNLHRPEDDQLDVYTLPLTDPGVYKLISSGETEGVFQLESTGFQGLLKKLKPDVFEDIVAAVALYRPGPLGSGMLDTFINRKHGLEEIIYPHDLLAEILKETYGVIVYQEQVMQIAQVMANFTLGAADLLRRAMGKKKMDVMAQQREVFAEGAAKNGAPRAKADEIFDLMELFAQYGFNKSHSAAYALLTYHTAFLKAHYPAEFMAAVLTNDSDTAEKVAKGVRNSLKMGLSISPPSINRSSRAFTGYQQEVIFGLGGIKGMGASAVDSIISSRNEGGLFSSFDDFCNRVNLQKVSKRTIETLIQVGAFDEFDLPRKRLHAAIEKVVARAQKTQKDAASGQNDMFSMFSSANPDPSHEDNILAEFEDIGEWNMKKLLEVEKALLGYYVSGHPLDRFASLIDKTQHCQIAQLNQMDRYAPVVIIGQVTDMRAIPSKRGGRVAFITFEDRSGAIEIITSGPTLEIYEQVLGCGEPIMIMGEVKPPRFEGENFKVNIGRRNEDPRAIPMVQTLSDLQSAKTRSIAIEWSETNEAKSKLTRLRTICEQSEYAGRCPLVFQLHTKDGARVYLRTRYNLHPDEHLVHEITQILPQAKVHFLDRHTTNRLLS
ncbi:MAG: DNA polymerase III subunit alpha [Myxococcales bacterium]|nr:DNA polymerase III subunit alpha [Myxococcales bacterium]